MPRLSLLIIGWSFLATLTSGQTATTPAPVPSGEIGDAPYRYNGFLLLNDSSGTVRGSASIVGPGILATAAHLLFDENNMQWVPIGNIRYYPKYHSSQDPLSSSAPSFTFPVRFPGWARLSHRPGDPETGLRRRNSCDT